MLRKLAVIFLSQSKSLQLRKIKRINLKIPYPRLRSVKKIIIIEPDSEWFLMFLSFRKIEDIVLGNRTL